MHSSEVVGTMVAWASSSGRRPRRRRRRPGRTIGRVDRTGRPVNGAIRPAACSREPRGRAWRAASAGSTRPADPPRGSPREDRPARLLDLLLHQLPPRPARPGQARGEVQERAGRHRRPHPQVLRRARHREPPPEGPRVRHQAPGRSTTPTRCSGPTSGSIAGRRCRPDRPATASRSGRQRARCHSRRSTSAIGQLVARAPSPGRAERDPDQVLPREREARRHPPALPGQGPGRRRRASGSSSPTPATTGSSSTDLNGKDPRPIGTGRPGLVDGGFAKAEFNRPQGMCLVENTLYVADTENHAIRAIDLKAKTVDDRRGQRRRQSHNFNAHGPGKTDQPDQPLGRGPHPRLEDAPDRDGRPAPDLALRPRRRRSSASGPARDARTSSTARSSTAAFAQPSGLATDGRTSSWPIRRSPRSARSRSRQGVEGHDDRRDARSCGQGLFVFDDVDGQGDEVRLQHCLGLAYGDGKLYIADTYNNKIKVCDPKTQDGQDAGRHSRAGDAQHSVPTERSRPGSTSRGA